MTPEELRKWCDHLDIRLASTSVLVTTLLAEQRALRHMLRVALAREGLTVQQAEEVYHSALQLEADRASEEFEKLLQRSAAERRRWQPPDPPAGAAN